MTATWTDQTNTTLPGHPRLLAGLPVLRRRLGDLQIGADPRHRQILTGVPDSLAPLLGALTGRLTLEELLARAGPDRAELLDILTGLAAAGLLVDTEPVPTSPVRVAAEQTTVRLRAPTSTADPVEVRRRAVVVVHGNGRVAVSIAMLLAGAGVGWVHPAASGEVRAEDTGCGYLDADIGLPRAHAAAAAIRRAAVEVHTEPLPARVRPDLVVLADQTVPDPVLTASLVAEAIPHLAARAAEGSGLVGPLVRPGRTCCLRCVDLHTADADGCWPMLAAQLCGASRVTDLATTQAVAAFAAAQALRALDPAAEPLPTHHAAVELDTHTAEARNIPLTVHPDCHCHVRRRNDARRMIRYRE
jgi:bacteriocin biosynthesis cyclodehydratase domain-containing protein